MERKRWSVNCAQVAERLMAADCKSAAPWSYGGSNPPLCTRLCVGKRDDFRRGWKAAERSSCNRRDLALLLSGVLAVLAWYTMEPGKFRALVVMCC